MGEVSFFFRLRHLYTACVGKTRATVFLLPYNDYKQLAATYPDDDATLLASLTDSVGTGKPQSSVISESMLDTCDEHSQWTVVQKVDEAIQRRTQQHVVKLLDAVFKNNIHLVKHMLDTGTVSVSSVMLHVCLPGVHVTRVWASYGGTPNAHACTLASYLILDNSQT